MKMAAFGCAWMLCLAPLTVEAANAKGVSEPSGCASAVLAPVPSAGTNVASGADEAEIHLTQQYALHRASLYLYNPAGEVRIAEMPGLVDQVEH